MDYLLIKSTSLAHKSYVISFRIIRVWIFFVFISRRLSLFLFFKMNDSEFVHFMVRFQDDAVCFCVLCPHAAHGTVK